MPFSSFERKFVQDLRQQQDEAYELSLKADQEKERLKQLEKDRVLQEQLKEEAERLEKQRQKEVSFNGKYLPTFSQNLMPMKII